MAMSLDEVMDALDDAAPDGVIFSYDENSPCYNIPKIVKLEAELGRGASTFTEEELARCLA